MTNPMKVNLNIGGFDRLRNEPKVKADLQRRANEVAKRAGAGFEVRNASGQKRARYTVTPTTAAARKAEAQNKVLSKALGAGGG